MTSLDGSLGQLCVVVISDGGALFEQHWPYWSKHAEPIFVMSSSDSISDLEIDPARQKDISILKYDGNYDTVFEALVNDEQLKEFQHILIYTDSIICLDIPQWYQSLKQSYIKNDLSNPQIYGIGGEAILWNRLALQSVWNSINNPKLSEAAKQHSTWKSFAEWAIQESKITVNALPAVANIIANAIAVAADIEAKKTHLVAGIYGPATLQFALAARNFKPSPQTTADLSAASSATVVEATITPTATTTAPTTKVTEVPRVMRSHGGSRKSKSTEEKVIAPPPNEPLASSSSSSSVTFVSGLFDIRRRENGVPSTAASARLERCKSVDDYLRLGHKLLDWNVNLFLTVEPNMVADIYKYREKLGLRDKTHIYPMMIEQSRYYELIPKLEALYAKGQVPKQYSLSKDTALYVWCMMQKAHSLRLAMQYNPWKSHKFYWIDYGIHHVAEPPKLDHLLGQINAINHTRLRMTALRPLNPAEMTNGEKFYSQLHQCIAGGFFGGIQETVQWFIEEWEKEMHMSLQWYPALDQAMFARIWARHPERFLLINGHHDGHRRLLLPRPNSEIIQEAQNALKSQNYDLATCWLQEIYDTKPINPQLQQQINAIHYAVGDASIKKQSNANATTPTTSTTAIKPAESVLVDEVIRMAAFYRVETHRSHAEKHLSQNSEVLEHALKGDMMKKLSHVNLIVSAMTSLYACPNMSWPLVGGTNLKKIRVFVVNMDRDKERWERMQRRFDMLGLNRYRIFSSIERWPAIDAADINNKSQLMALPFWNQVSMIRRGAIGIFGSLYHLWGHAAKVLEDDEWALFMEDDAIFAPSFVRDMTIIHQLTYQNALSKLCDVLWPGYHIQLLDRWKAIGNPDAMQMMPLKENWITQAIGGMFGHMMNKKGAQLAYDLATQGHNHKPKEPVDEWFMRRVHDRVRHVCPSRPIIMSAFKDDGTPYDGDISTSKPF